MSLYRTQQPVDPRPVEPVEAARAPLAAERRVLRAEVEAFRSFCRRVEALDTEPACATAAAPSAVGALTTRREHAAEPASDPVQEAYAETVMATPHYDDEYGDGFWASVASEFGPELALALRQASAVTPLLRDQLLSAARDAKRSRERMLDTLAGEADALDAAEAVLRSVREDLAAVRSRPFGDCSERERRRLLADLDALEADCQNLAVRRQDGDLEPETFHLPNGDVSPLTDYLYQSQPVTHPVLAAVGRASDGIATATRRLRRVSDVEADDHEYDC